MAWDLGGWKKKAERLRMVILSGGHQGAREMPPTLSKVLALFRRTAETGDGSTLQAEIEKLVPDEHALLWEPIDVHGWEIKAAMYLQEGQRWWLAHANRRNANTPSEKDIAFLNKVLDHLGADPKRDMIIGPSSSPVGEPALAFGWWTWFNRMALYEIQVCMDKKTKEMIRVVPFGTAESDGYIRLDPSKAPKAS